MAVLSVMAIRVAPGRMEEFVAGASELNAVVARLAGGTFRGLRVFQSLIGGTNTGTVLATFEYDDLASWGASNDREVHDAAWRALAERLGGPDGPATIIARELYQELDLP